MDFAAREVREGAGPRGIAPVGASYAWAYRNRNSQARLSLRLLLPRIRQFSPEVQGLKPLRMERTDLERSKEKAVADAKMTGVPMILPRTSR